MVLRTVQGIEGKNDRTMTKTGIEIISSTRVTRRGGVMHRCKHKSSATKTDMVFAVFLPADYTDLSANGQSIPAIYWLSGLTCTDENFCQKAGPVAFEAAENHGLAMVMPDTSPRGADIPSDDSYDLGSGAGFYVDATNPPWNINYRMETYVKEELSSLVEVTWGVGTKGLRSICGHSMGGHGALTIALKAEPGSWVSVSAIAPICHPSACPWGIKAFMAYFGSVEEGTDNDATILIGKEGKSGLFDDILIDEGTEDNFAKSGQLLLDDFIQAATQSGQKVTARRQDGFDHSYYFIAAFIADHIDFHASKLKLTEDSMV